MNKKPLEKFIAVVAGASRGAGKGTALALGQSGATVFVTVFWFLILQKNTVLQTSMVANRDDRSGRIVERPDGIERQEPSRFTSCSSAIL